MMNPEQAIREAKATVAVIGLGHVGLPVACTVAQAGFSVWGVERDPAKREQIARGVSPISGDEPGLAPLLQGVIESRALRVVGDPSECGQVDIFLVAVETPVDPVTRAPAYQALRGALTALGPQLKPGALVVVESTIAPGTMEQLVKPTLEATSGLRAGGEFRLAYCPERVMPGKLLANLRTCNRVIGGLTPQAAELARELNISVPELEKMMLDANAVNLISLNKKWYETDSYKDVREIDILEDKKGEDPTRRIQKNDLMRLVTKGLNRNERLIIILYYYEELTMKEIGATLDLSESRVSQMHSSIVQRLQIQLGRRRPEFGHV